MTPNNWIHRTRVQALTAMGATTCKRIAGSPDQYSVRVIREFFNVSSDREGENLTDVTPDGSNGVDTLVPDNGVDKELQIRDCDPKGIHPNGRVLGFHPWCEWEQCQHESNE